MALYLPDFDAAFIHIPKAGGTWVKAALASSGIRCEPIGRGEHGLAIDIQRPCRKFCFVRHPLTWVESAWRGLHPSWPQRRDVLPLHCERTWSPIRNLTYLASDRDFNGFIETLLMSQRGFVTRMFESYIGPIGYPLVDFVGRMESLRGDLLQILRWLGWDGALADVEPANEGSNPRPEWEPALKIKFLASESPAINRWYGPNAGPWRVTTE